VVTEVAVCGGGVADNAWAFGRGPISGRPESRFTPQRLSSN
jgi:hypothetical protein